MVEMVALCAGGGHDRRIGDRRAVVAHDGARKARGDADDEKLAVRREHVRHDRDQNAERTPARAGGEGKTAANEEDDRREHVIKALRRALHHAVHILRRAEHAGHVLERYGKRENEQRRNHGDEALRRALHRFLEAQQAAADVVDHGEYERDERTPGQADGGVRPGEGRGERRAGEESADIQHAGDAADDENKHREYEIDDLALGRDGHALRIVAPLAGGEEVAVEPRVHFVQLHRAIVKLHERETDNENKRKEAVVVPGDGTDEELRAGHDALVHNAGDRRRPRRDRRDHAYGRGSRIDEIGELGTGDAVAIRHGTHDAADGEAVKIVVHKNQHAEKERSEHRAGAGVHILFRPASERRRAARAVHERNKDAEQDEKQENTDVPGVRHTGDEAVVDNDVERPDRRESGDKRRAHDDAEKERGIDLLGDQRQSNGDDRRQQRPDGTVKHAKTSRVCKKAVIPGGRIAAVHTKSVIKKLNSQQ